MGVDQAKSPETAGGGAEAVQTGDEDAVVGAHDHEGHFAPSGNQDADLAVDLPGKFGEPAGQFMGNDPLRRDTPPVDLPDAPDFIGAESGQVSVDLFDGRSLPGNTGT